MARKMSLRERVSLFLDKKHEGTPVHAYIAETAELIGDVRVGKDVSIWPRCVLRADINFIEIGDGTNVQDGTIMHLSDDYPVIIGKNVTIGHGAMLHACTVKDACLIGMRSTILDGAVIGEGSIIGANALVTEGSVIPPGSLVLGVPGKVSRVLTEEEQQEIMGSARKYRELAGFYARRGL